MVNTNNLVSRLTGLKDRLLDIPERFGVPQYRTVYIRKLEYQEDNVFANRYDLKLDTPCRVQNVRTRLVGLPVDDNTILGYDDVELRISRSYSLDTIQNNIKYYIIDPQIDSQGKITSGVRCRLIHIDDSRLLDWIVILRIFGDDRTVEPLEDIEREPTETPEQNQYPGYYLNDNSDTLYTAPMANTNTTATPITNSVTASEPTPEEPLEVQPDSTPDNQEGATDEPLLFEDTPGDFLYYGDY